MVQADGRLERRLQKKLLLLLLLLKESLLLVDVVKQVGRELVVLYLDEVVEVGGGVGVVVVVDGTRPRGDGIVTYRRMRKHSLGKETSEEAGGYPRGRGEDEGSPPGGVLLIYSRRTGGKVFLSKVYPWVSVHNHNRSDKPVLLTDLTVAVQGRSGNQVV